MKDRIVQLRKSLGLTQGEFGKKIGLTDPMISLFESGKKTPQEGTIHLICLTFGVREGWFRTGEGKMMDNEALLPDRERRLLDLFRRLSPKAREMLIEYAEKLISDERTLRGELEEKGEKSS
jgi:transcriptional regulator with XRE-family HTH domain